MKKFYENMGNFDLNIIYFSKKIVLPLAKFSIFLLYFWFGILKVFSISEASPLVLALLNQTMPFIDPDLFLVAFGIIEMIIGVIFLIPRLERLAVFTLFLHLITTIMPLFILPEFSWQTPFAPTIEGQYMIKNILLFLAGFIILADLKPYKENTNV